MGALQLPNTAEQRRELVLILEVYRKGEMLTEGLLGSARMFVDWDTDTAMREYPLMQVGRSVTHSSTQPFIVIHGTQ